MNIKIQQQVDETLDGLDTVQQATAPSHLYGKIVGRLQQAKTKYKTISKAAVWVAAACFTLLVSVNIWLGTAHTRDNKNTARKEIQQVLNDYQLQDKIFSY